MRVVSDKGEEEMNKKELRWMLFAVIVAGFWGGLLSNVFFVESVFAQKKSAQFENAVKAENFELVDKQGRTRAKLMMGEDQEPVLVVYDKNEKATAAYGLSGEGPVQNILKQLMRP
jgi:hypothetical protein